MGPAFVNPQTGEAVPAPPELVSVSVLISSAKVVTERAVQFMNGGNEMQQQGGRGQRGGRGRGGRGGGRDKDGNRRNDKQQQQPMMFPQGMPMFFAPGPNGQPQPFFPQASNQPGSPSFFPFQQAGGMPGFPQAQQQQQQQASLPSKPSQEGLCKYATECKNAYCKFSHPSPAATKESGLTLSSEPCDRQLQCEDAVCLFGPLQRNVWLIRSTGLGLREIPRITAAKGSGQLKTCAWLGASGAAVRPDGHAPAAALCSASCPALQGRFWSSSERASRAD